MRGQNRGVLERGCWRGAACVKRLLSLWHVHDMYWYVGSVGSGAKKGELRTVVLEVTLHQALYVSFAAWNLAGTVFYSQRYILYSTLCPGESAL